MRMAVSNTYHLQFASRKGAISEMDSRTAKFNFPPCKCSQLELIDTSVLGKGIV